MNSARSSALASVTPSVGVSMKPGLTTFTRMPRVTSSAAKPEAIERSAALVALYTLMPCMPPSSAMDEVKTIALPAGISGARRCTVKNGPLVLTAKARS
ncbi:hypothetical protein D9M72_400730 [compost metagenome]